MKVRRTLALLLAPDLHQVARGISGVEHALEVAQKRSQEARVADLVGASWCMAEVEEILVESRARLLEVHAALTGRRLDSYPPAPDPLA